MKNVDGDVSATPVPNPRFAQIVKRATQLAQQMGQSHAGTEHLLLALIEDRDGIAGQILGHEQLGDRIRKAVEIVMADPAYRTSTRRVYR